MPARKILTADSLVRAGRALQVGSIDPDVIDLCQDLVDTLAEASGSLALAAPQIGHASRVIVVDLDGRPEARLANGPLIILNPEVIASDGAAVAEETCVSLPGFRGPVLRPERIFLRGITIQGTQVGAETSGLEARLIQHALDHLDGVLIDGSAGSH